MNTPTTIKPVMLTFPRYLWPRVHDFLGERKIWHAANAVPGVLWGGEMQVWLAPWHAELLTQMMPSDALRGPGKGVQPHG
jgi:hypothetical protein